MQIKIHYITSYSWKFGFNHFSAIHRSTNNMMDIHKTNLEKFVNNNNSKKCIEIWQSMEKGMKVYSVSQAKCIYICLL